MKNIIISFISSIILLSCSQGDLWTSANLLDSSLLILINSTDSTDSTAPIIHSISATSTTGVRVTFSEDIEETSANTLSNYSIPGLTVTSATRDASDYSIVDLVTSSHKDINYTLTVTGVNNTDGNTIGLPNSGVFAGDVAPTIKSVSSFTDTINCFVVIYFSEAMHQGSVETTGNYDIDTVPPGTPLTISSATRGPVDRVVLQTSVQTDAQDYEITIHNGVGEVRDTNGNLLADPNFEHFIGTNTTDGTAPWVVSAIRIDNNTVEVAFSEPVDEGTSETAGNYTIYGSDGNNIAPGITITGVTNQFDQTSADPSKVHLQMSATLSDHIYTIEVTAASVFDISTLNGIEGSPRNKAAFAGTGSIPDTFANPVIIDPMIEGTNPFSMLVEYKGRIYIGPADADNAMFRMKPDGSDPEIVKFNFHGAAGDQPSLAPGPDAEDSIDYIAAGTIGGVEYLFIGPGKSGGDLNYIYSTTDTGSTMDFEYIDYSALLGVNTRGTSSMLVFNDRLYAGFPSTGGRPEFVKFDGITAVDLCGDIMTRIGNNAAVNDNGATTVGLDSMAVFGDSLYIGNGGNNNPNEDGGILRSKNNNPGPWTDIIAPIDDPEWEDITPANDTVAYPEWYNTVPGPADRFSIALPGTNKLLPADKAFPAMAVFNGNLYIARNTTIAHDTQLWKYDGSLWSLVTVATSVPAPKSVALLVVNGDRLYVGFNGNSNIEIYRTTSGITNPSSSSDFESVAIGTPNTKKIYHGLSVSDGVNDYLWLLCGLASEKMYVYRMRN